MRFWESGCVISFVQIPKHHLNKRMSILKLSPDLAKALVGLLKGEIHVEIVYGRASKFTTILPRDLPGPVSALEAA